MNPPTAYHVRCIGCGSIVASKQELFLEGLNKGLTPDEALKASGIRCWGCIRAISTPFVMPVGFKYQTRELENKLSMISTATVTQAPSLPKNIIAKNKYPDVPKIPLEVALRGLEPSNPLPEPEPTGRERWPYMAR